MPTTIFQDDLAPIVARAFRAALDRLTAAGATIVELPMAEFNEAATVNPRGTISSYEAYTYHRKWLQGSDKYDPRVLFRIRGGEAVTSHT